MASPFDSLTDDDLDRFRTEAKRKASGTRLKAKPKQIFLEQQFELASVDNPERMYRLYRRHHPQIDSVFSVGLAVCLGSDWLTICRYNGSYHPHRNHIERNRLINVCHIHLATQRYILQAAHPDGYAEATDKYASIDGAFRCMLLDSNISGVLPDGDTHPETKDLDFE